MTAAAFRDTRALTGRSLRHILRSPDTIITTAVMPVAIMVMFVYVLGGAINTGPYEYIDYMEADDPELPKVEFVLYLLFKTILVIVIVLPLSPQP